MPQININGGQLYYEEKGQGFPVIFSHSFLWESAMWQPQIEALSKNFRCISIDLWNHGKSGHLPQDNYSIEQCAKDYWLFTQQMKLDEFAFIGLSVGGMIGAHIAIEHPQAVKALALVATFVGPEPDISKAEFEILLNTIETAGHFNQELVDGIAPYFFSPKTYEKNAPIVQNFKRALASTPRENVPGIVDLGRAILVNRQCILGRLPELKMPTLVIVGEDDLPRPPSESKQMSDKIVGSTLAIIEDAGHICCLEDPANVTAALEGLLAKLS